MCGRQRLGRLEMSVSRHDRPARGLRLLDQRPGQVEQRRLQRLARTQQPQQHVGRHLVVAAAPGVQLARHVAHQLAQAALDGGVNILVARRGSERPARELGAHALQPASEDLVLGLRQHARPNQRLGPGDAARDVDIVQAPVEAQAVVQPAYGVIGGP